LPGHAALRAGTPAGKFVVRFGRMGTDLFVLQRRLGHESITTTTETYAHLMPDQQKAAADAAAKALSGLVPQTSRP